MSCPANGQFLICRSRPCGFLLPPSLPLTLARARVPSLRHCIIGRKNNRRHSTHSVLIGSIRTHALCTLNTKQIHEPIHPYTKASDLVLHRPNPQTAKSAIHLYTNQPPIHLIIIIIINYRYHHDHLHRPRSRRRPRQHLLCRQM